MPRILIPTNFKYTIRTSDRSTNSPALELHNASQHSFVVHPMSDSIVRVVHQLPTINFPQKTNGGIDWETPAASHFEVTENNGVLVVETAALRIVLHIDGCPRLEWFSKLPKYSNKTPFLADSNSRAYAYDAASGGVMHYVEAENQLPVSEAEDGFAALLPGTLPLIHDERNEFVYGLGESRGSLLKTGKKFTMQGRDALAYDWEHGDPLYKLNPFYTVYNKKTNLWYGIFYNNLSDSTFDMGAEHDSLFGCFRVYQANCGPLDYYVILGDGTLPSIISAYAALVSPKPPPTSPYAFAASPTLPPLSQFGYLSSSLTLAALPHAQDAITSFLNTTRSHGFPVDGLYLSSGWCQHPTTGDRNYFVWNTQRYPSPSRFGEIVEAEMGVKVIVNVKPWLLEEHPEYGELDGTKGFVRAAEDAKGDSERESKGGAAVSWLWSRGFGEHKKGSYLDYSSKAGTQWWKEKVDEQILKNNLTGLWIDNNEISGLKDDEERFQGELGMFAAQGVENNVEQRMGWRGGAIRVGSVGKAIQTMGMARATYEALLTAHPNSRPVIISRSGVPGIQAYAHGTWSGDNSTTWKALKWGTKMTLSVGMSFGPGLYGHDIGGFAGKHHPSPELLVRWCQNGAWHSRFTVHSWKEVSTTLYMYNDVPGITDILRKVLAFRYRLVPTFYSLYVMEYHRRGWPLLKPILWHHSCDPVTLHLDEEFIFGSHVLVACATEKGVTNRPVYLPSSSNNGEDGLHWCELDTGKWHAGEGKFVVLDAPLERTPVLVRAGGIIVLGGPCEKNVYDGVHQRTALIFPSPATSSKSAKPDTKRSGMSGSFTLIEDDGRTNDHTDKGVYTELELTFAVVDGGNGEEVIEVDCAVVKGGYKLPYDAIWFELPLGDEREVRAAKGKIETKRAADGRPRGVALSIKL
ncbi:hypothetical protein BD410DRAFT_3704 [Rickenella mellea]|uniref:Uncharacterized protein n=1 Tax=Rickenella mellea TaxID=50990 RepID=A0A4R5XDG3_9AGAM|nr:hypothetical protein BD410DRAFT_3704 [Rickenella mellea]